MGFRLGSGESLQVCKLAINLPRTAWVVGCQPVPSVEKTKLQPSRIVQTRPGKQGPQKNKFAPYPVGRMPGNLKSKGLPFVAHQIQQHDLNGPLM